MHVIRLLTSVVSLSLQALLGSPQLMRDNRDVFSIVISVQVQQTL